MDDTQFGTLILALNRIGDALEQHNMLIMASQPDRPAPKLQRPLAAYATFDWSSIGAEVIAQDRHGATEVEWNGRLFTRRRSAEDDDKGEDIRFSRVASGIVAEQNVKWETLIKFGGNRKPAKPLRGELAEKVEQATRAAAPATPPSSPAPTVTQPAPAVQAPTAAPAPAPDPTPPTAATSKRTFAAEDRHRAAVAAARARMGEKWGLPPHLSMEWDDEDKHLDMKTAGLLRIAETGDWMTGGGAFPKPAPSAPSAPPSANPEIQIDPLERAKTEVNAELRRVGAKSATIAQRKAVVDAIEAHGCTPDSLCLALWGRTATEVSAAQVLAMFQWMRPASGKGGVFASNQFARDFIKSQAMAQLAGQPA